ncbi:hypothetical protein K227x_44170 [Rubripirellula lacrimiformis]|uniref:Uncharacterized protein n=2 Tax=Rubripirellula lacrimiformis TaxID=1930273 RepID=A0A517NFW4_9BACT|nr:hypothetical protein K227x_44170 [Rubripirellula lacrimiformis]
MWPTVDGLRMLRGAEAELLRGAIDMMVDHLLAEYRDDENAWRYGIDGFDMWDADQRIWMLEQVTRGLLTRRRPLAPAAIWEATIDAILCEIMDQIEIEITDPTLANPDRTWRQCVMDAFHCQQGRFPSIDPADDHLSNWRAVVATVGDVILAAASYQKTESLRDTNIERLQQFLVERGLPDDFLDVIPPIRSVEQTQASIDKIRSLVAS